MRELLRSNDPVRLDWLRTLLADQGIETVVFDRHTAVLEGSANAIVQRLMVVNDDYGEACLVLAECGEQVAAEGDS